MYSLVVSWAYLLEKRGIFSPQVLRFFSISLWFLSSYIFGSLTVPAYSFVSRDITWSESMVILIVTKYSSTLLYILGFTSLFTTLVLSAQLEDYSPQWTRQKLTLPDNFVPPIFKASVFNKELGVLSSKMTSIFNFT